MTRSTGAPRLQGGVPGAPSSSSRTLLRTLMAAALLVAGSIHLLLVPEHLGESTILGLGFLASGIAQVVLAGLALWRVRAWSLGLTVMVNVTLIALYAYAVLVGLPFGAGSEHVHGEAAGLMVGSGEPIDAYGAVSKLAELLSTAIAAALLVPSRLQNHIGSTN